MRELDADLKRKFKFNLIILRISLFSAGIIALLSLSVFFFAWLYPWNVSNFIFPKPASDYVTSFAQVLGAISGVLFLYAAFLGQQQQMIIQQQDIRSQNEFNNRTINNQYFFELLNRLTLIKNSLVMTSLEPDTEGNHKTEYGDHALSYFIRRYLPYGNCYLNSNEFPKNTDPFVIYDDPSQKGPKLKMIKPEFLKREHLKFIFDNYEKIWGI